MRLHTNELHHTDIHRAVGNIPGSCVGAEIMDHGSHTHRRAFEVSLSGWGDRHTRLKNTGQRGASDEFAATWDDWGWFLSYLYDIDPQAIWGAVKRPVYADASRFHLLTWDRFNVPPAEFPDEPLLPLKMRELARLRSEAYRKVYPSGIRS